MILCLVSFAGLKQQMSEELYVEEVVKRQKNHKMLSGKFVKFRSF